MPGAMKKLALWLAVILIALLLWLARPLSVHGLESRAHPSRDYGEALRMAAALQAQDSPEISTECRTLLLTHGHATARVIVLLHGLTNCPAQFDSIARLSFATGANVFVPRLPHHGLADNMTDALASTRSDELRDFTDRALDAAHGLGDSMTVAGLSVGGTLAAWASVERHDVDRVVLIAPLFGLALAPGGWTPAVTRLANLLPNRFMWWDPRVRDQLPGPKHVYPRFATRAIGATLELGAATLERARQSGVACRSCAMITVDSDLAVDNGQCAEMVKAWLAHGARNVQTYQFPKSLGLNHDIVDPEQAGGNPALTYPVLLKMIAP